MAKRLFLLLLIVGASFSPSFLMATDSVEIIGINDARSVETILLTIPESEEAIAPKSETNLALNSKIVAKAPLAGVSTKSSVPEVNYTVTIVTNHIVLENLSYYDIYRTGKFIYAHNTPRLLGGLKNLKKDDIFTITESGVTQKYQVMDKLIYEKASNGYLNGDITLTRSVERNANGYDRAIMTCYGTTYKNGDASHRLVLFANAI